MFKCLFGHDWGRQDNIRNDDGLNMLAFVDPILFVLMEPSKICDRKCLTCGKVKSFNYDSRR